MGTLSQNLRFALRQLGRNPGFALTVILTLALSIGANTAIFSIVNALMLKSLPYAHPERMGAFLERTGGDWIFVVRPDGRSAERRRIKIGRRTSEQLEVLSGLRAGEQVVTSDYTGLDKVDRIVFTR